MFLVYEALEPGTLYYFLRRPSNSREKHTLNLGGEKTLLSD